MMVFSRSTLLAMGILALGLAGPAGAQENLDSGKSAAQLFASDCAICHKSPQGLIKANGGLGLENFLREHYTASRESAASIARYLRSADKGAPPPSRAVKRSPKGGEKKKPEAGKAGAPKAAEPASSETKPVDAKAPEPKAEPKAEPNVEPKAAEPAPSEPKPAESPKAN